MAKDTPKETVIDYTAEQKAEHARREKIALTRDKKLKNPNDGAQPAEQPTTQPTAVGDTAGPSAKATATKKTTTRR